MKNTLKVIISRCTKKKSSSRITLEELYKDMTALQDNIYKILQGQHNVPEPPRRSSSKTFFE